MDDHVAMFSSPFGAQDAQPSLLAGDRKWGGTGIPSGGIGRGGSACGA